MFIDSHNIKKNYAKSAVLFLQNNGKKQKCGAIDYLFDTHARATSQPSSW